MSNRIHHTIQSNLTKLTQGIVDAFVALGIDQVGSSYEPIPEIRGIGIKRDSTLYDRLFFKGTRLLEQNHLGWGIIYTVIKGSLEAPIQIFKFLTNMNPSRGPSFNKIYVYGEDAYGLNMSQAEYADFLGQIFPLWWENQDRYGAVRFFAYLTRTIRDGRLPGVCEHTGECARQWVYIGPTGITSHCGRAGDLDAFTYGRIQDRTLDEVLNDKLRDTIYQRNCYLPQKDCHNCRFWGTCHGGCPMDAYLGKGKFLCKSGNCGWLRIFLEKYYKPITGLRVDMRPRNCDGV